MKKRNSLIELYRFIFAMNVVKNHGFFPYQGSYFSPGRISVEFFFILSGFLSIKSINRLKDMQICKGIFKMIVTKIVPIAVPLVIGVLFNVIEMFVTSKFSFDLLGYLWYIQSLIFVSIIYLIVRKLAKSEKKFFCIVLSIFVFFTIMNCFELFYSWGDVRALSAMSLGMIISYIPDIKSKNKKQLLFILIPIQIAALSMLLFRNNLWSEYSFILERVTHWIIYPSLIYFTFQIECNNRLFNYLGSISFGLYAYQCVASCIREIGLNNVYILFAIVFGLAVIENVIKRVYTYFKNKNAVVVV